MNATRRTKRRLYGCNRVQRFVLNRLSFPRLLPKNSEFRSFVACTDLTAFRHFLRRKHAFLSFSTPIWWRWMRCYEKEQTKENHSTGWPVEYKIWIWPLVSSCCFERDGVDFCHHLTAATVLYFHLHLNWLDLLWATQIRKKREREIDREHTSEQRG